MSDRRNLVTFETLRPGDRYRLPPYRGRQDPAIYTLQTSQPDNKGRDYLLNTISIDEQGNVFKGWPNRMTYVELIVEDKTVYTVPTVDTTPIAEIETVEQEINTVMRHITQISLKNQRQGRALLDYMQELILRA